MSHVPHPDARGNAPHPHTSTDGDPSPRVEYAHPFLRALAEAEHPEFKAPSGPDGTERRFVVPGEQDWVWRSAQEVEV